MSNFSNAHTVVNYDSKKSQAADGQRLAKVLFKTTAKQTAPMPSKCASVPVITDAEYDGILPALKPQVLAMLEKAQDEIIRAKLLEFGEGYEVLDSHITMNECVSYLAEEAKGNRLSKESIAEWFNSNMAELLTVAIADKLGIGDTPTANEAAKMEQIVAGYCAGYSALAGSKTAYAPEFAVKLLRGLEVAADDSDRMAIMFKSKLEAMKVRPVADLLGL